MRSEILRCTREGFDGGKKTHGRKRHIGVDILGLLLHVFCHAANLSDTKQACTVMDRLIDKYPTIQAYAGDGGYRGAAVEYARTVQNRRFEAILGLTGPYVPMAKRWVVDRTFGWMSHSRRLTRDYEIIPRQFRKYGSHFYVENYACKTCIIFSQTVSQ